MSYLIGILDSGEANIMFNGQRFKVGMVTVRVSEDESEPFEYLGYCNPSDKDTIIKHLEKLYFPNRETSIISSAETYKLRAESLVDVFLFLENIRSQLKCFTVNSIPHHPHVEVIFETELAFAEIKKEIESIYNAQIMIDTIQPIEKYTGAIK